MDKNKLLLDASNAAIKALRGLYLKPEAIDSWLRHGIPAAKILSNIDEIYRHDKEIMSSEESIIVSAKLKRRGAIH